MRRVGDPGRPVALGRLRRDLGRFLAVVAAVRDEVLEDDLLDVSVPGERLQRRHPVFLGLPDADQDPARERDLQVAGGPDRLQSDLRVLGRRALVGDEVRVRGLEHQALGRGHRAQPGEVGRGQHAEVRVRQQPAVERFLAGPRHVGDEVLEPECFQAVLHRRRLAGEHEQLLDAAARGAVDQPLDLLRLMQVGLVRRERAVLAMAAARARQRERDVAREGDPAHASATIPGCDFRPYWYSCSRSRAAAVPNPRAPSARSGWYCRPPGADEVGVYFATARGFDTAEGVTLQVKPEGDFRLVTQPPAGCVPVMTVVRPDKLVLCVDSVVMTRRDPRWSRWCER